MDWNPFAILLIDVQEDFWPASTAAEFPSFPERVAGLLAFAREQRIDVIHLHARFKADRSDWMARYKVGGRKLPCIENTPGVSVLDCAAPEPGEKIIVKQSFDGFCSAELERILRENNKRYLLVAGLITSVCVLFTAASAAQRGYLVALLEDCCADKSLTIHNSVLNNYPFVFERVTVDSIAEHYDRWMGELQKL